MDVGLVTASLIYIYLSVFIFVLGWVKPIFSIPTAIILLVSIIIYIKNYKKKSVNYAPIFIKVKHFILLCVVIFIFGNIFGWTGLFNQTRDWNKHNSILNDLTNFSWPVYYEKMNEVSMLTYYLGQYMVPSLVGKMFSSVLVTQAVNGIWAMIGLLLATLGVFKVTKSNTWEKQLSTFFIILFFSSSMILAQWLAKIFIPEKYNGFNCYLMFGKDNMLQLSSNITLLRWVMQQIIVPWIVMTLLLEDPYDIKNYMLLALPVIFYSTLSAIGFIVILICLAIINIVKHIKSHSMKELFIEIFSYTNILTMASLGTILFIYYYGNVFSEKPASICFKIIKYGSQNISIYFIFLTAFLPYTLLLFKTNKKNPFYWIATIILLFLPFGSMGFYNDFLMRVSIIPLYIYMILSIIQLYSKDVTKLSKVLLCCFLVLGFALSINELDSAFDKPETIEFKSLEYSANRSSNYSDDLKYNYYSYDLDNNLFYNYLARKQK